jgi:hypothetical protein
MRRNIDKGKKFHILGADALKAHEPETVQTLGG